MSTALEGGEGPASRPSHSLPLGKIWYPLYMRLGGPQGWSGQVCKISTPTGIGSPDRPASSQSLYRLHYLAHKIAESHSSGPITGSILIQTKRLINSRFWHPAFLSLLLHLYRITIGYLLNRSLQYSTQFDIQRAVHRDIFL